MYNMIITTLKGYKMIRKTLGLFALLLLLGTTSMASESINTTDSSTVSTEEVDFGTDSYDEDGCFC